MIDYRKTSGLTLEELLERQQESGIDAAIRAGNVFKDRVLMRKDMFTATEAAGKLTVPPGALKKMASDRKVLRLEGMNGNHRYPSFQFENGVLPVIERLFAAMPDSDSWAIYLFLTQPDPALYPGTSLEWIKNGKESEVLRLAKDLSRT